MARIRNSRGFSFFRRTLLWYLTSVAVFVILCCVVFFYVAAMERQKVIADQTSALRQSGENLDRINRSVVFGANVIRLNSQIIHFMNLAKDESKVYPVRETALSLGSIFLDDQIFDGYYLYDLEKEIIFMNQSASARLQEFYPDFYYIDGYDFDSWRKEVLMPLTPSKYLTASQTRINNLDGRRIPYISSILSAAGTHIGQSVFFINESVVLQNLQLVLDIGASVASITDINGQLIAATDYDPNALAFLGDPTAQVWTLDGQKCMIVRYHAAGSDWMYQALIPASVVMVSMAPLLRILMLILVVMLILGGTLALVFAYLYSTPLQRILDKIRPVLAGSTPKNHIELMNEGISILLDNREVLEKNTAKQREMLAETFLLRLMHGGFDASQEIEQTLAHLNIALNADRFRVILIALNLDDSELGREQLERLDTQRAMLAEVLSGYPDEVLLHSVVSSRTLAVLYADGGLADQCAAFCTRLNLFLSQQLNTPTWYFAGIAVDSLAKVNESFASAEQLYSFRLSDIERSVNIVQEQDNLARCNFTLDDERRLLSYAATGDFARLDNLLENIYQVNFSKHPLNAMMTRLLIDSITNTLIKTIDQKFFNGNKPEIHRKLENQIAQIAQCHSPVAAFAAIKVIYADICELILLKKKDQSTILINEMLDYINQNYADANLSLEQTARRFGITCPYLSSFFKEHHGENFSVYLEQTRIRKANEWMARQELSISEVAEKVGYTNVYTFRRAYTRVMGYSPSQHKHVERRIKQ